jgi:hypothetical protein
MHALFEQRSPILVILEQRRGEEAPPIREEAIFLILLLGTSIAGRFQHDETRAVRVGRPRFGAAKLCVRRWRGPFL